MEPAAAPGEAARKARRKLAWRAALVLPVFIGPAWSLLFTPLFPESLLATWSGGILVVVVGVCAYTDLRWHRIYNWATYTAFLWGLALNAALEISALFGQPITRLGHGANPPLLNLGAIGLGRSALSGLVTFLLMFVLYRLSRGGAGDVKLATAISVYLGLERTFAMLIYSYLTAGLFGLCLLIWQVGPWASLVYLFRKVGSALLPGRVAPPAAEVGGLLMQRIPLGGFFAIGTLAVLAEGLPWFDGVGVGGAE